VRFDNLQVGSLQIDGLQVGSLQIDGLQVGSLHTGNRSFVDWVAGHLV